MDALERVEVRRVAAAIAGGGAAIFLGNDSKTFIIYVGYFEANAILTTMQGRQAPRPMTHDLIRNVFVGFDVEVKQVIISSLVDNTFCATLVLEQALGEGEFAGKRRSVRIDARASDSIVIALKTNSDIWVSRQVLDAVEDVSGKLQDLDD